MTAASAFRNFPRGVWTVKAERCSNSASIVASSSPSGVIMDHAATAIGFISLSHFSAPDARWLGPVGANDANYSCSRSVSLDRCLGLHQFAELFNMRRHAIGLIKDEMMLSLH